MVARDKPDGQGHFEKKRNSFVALALTPPPHKKSLRLCVSALKNFEKTPRAAPFGLHTPVGMRYSGHTYG
jgi:hypothetical protein